VRSIPLKLLLLTSFPGSFVVGELSRLWGLPGAQTTHFGEMVNQQSNFTNY
jgi:hypothetical protein